MNRELNRIPSASLQIDDGEASKATFPASDSGLFLPGNPIEIQFGYRSQNQTVFKGRIVKQKLKVRKSGGVLSVDCYADAVTTTAARKSKYFVDMKDSDIMGQVLDAHTLANSVEATTAIAAALVPAPAVFIENSRPDMSRSWRCRISNHSSSSIR